MWIIILLVVLYDVKADLWPKGKSKPNILFKTLWSAIRCIYNRM